MGLVSAYLTWPAPSYGLASISPGDVGPHHFGASSITGVGHGEGDTCLPVDIQGVLHKDLRPIEVSAGRSSSDIRSTATLTITGDTRGISGERTFLSVATVSS